mgnify:CR=1 FL=1
MTENDDQCALGEVDESLPQVRQKYAEMMDFVDNSDQHISNSFSLPQTPMDGSVQSLGPDYVTLCERQTITPIGNW